MAKSRLIDKLVIMVILMSMMSFDVGASTVEWQSCSNSNFSHWFKFPPSPMLQCGYLGVPLRYISGTSLSENGFGDEVRLALTRLPSKGLSKGTLVVISGGPGFSGIAPSWIDTDEAAKKIHESWDIVGYDPRGVGQSEPKIDCKIPEELSASENHNQNLLDACVKNTGAEVLKHMGTDEAVSDVERIRQAVNDKKLTALASSYGTQVALLYAERFPDSVRALVLDGVVDIEEARNDFIMRLNQARGYQASFERFAVWCAETKQCPLSADKAIATRQYKNLLSKLDYDPLLGPDGQQVSAYELLTLTTSLLLWKSSWSDLATIVRQLSQGEINEEASVVLNSSDDIDVTGNLEDALIAITCIDTSPSELSPDDILRQRRRIREAFPATNFQPIEVDDAIELCDLWPWKSNFHARRPANKPALPQLLFVTQRHDPTTPWQNARNMATLFKGALITLEGDGHTLALTGSSTCIDKTIIDYLNAPDKRLGDRICY